MCVKGLALSLSPSQILSRSCGENREKAWDQNYVTDQKWWTWSVRNVDSVWAFACKTKKSVVVLDYYRSQHLNHQFFFLNPWSLHRNLYTLIIGLVLCLCTSFLSPVSQSNYL